MTLVQRESESYCKCQTFSVMMSDIVATEAVTQPSVPIKGGDSTPMSDNWLIMIS